MRRVVAPLPDTSSWCDAQLSTGYDFMAWYLVRQRDNSTFHTIVYQNRVHVLEMKWVMRKSQNKN
jgi:hypothetical protein